MAKHHILPKKSYLRGFADNQKESGFIYRLTVHTKEAFEKLKIRSSNISKIAIEEDFYTIKNSNNQDLFGTRDKEIIEKSAFEYERKKLKSIVETLQNRNSDLDISQRKKLISIVLNLKFRGLVFRNALTKIYSRSQAGGFSEIENQLKGVTHIETIPKKYIIDYLKFEFWESEENIIDTHLYGLQKWFQETDFTIQMQKEILKKSIIEVVKTDLSNPFVTSNNPGFIFQSNDVYSDFGFLNMKSYYFPLTSNICLVFHKDHESNNDFSNYPIQFTEADCERVEFINVITGSFCHSEVFSSKKHSLEKIKEIFEEREFSNRTQLMHSILGPVVIYR